MIKKIRKGAAGAAEKNVLGERVVVVVVVVIVILVGVVQVPFCRSIHRRRCYGAVFQVQTYVCCGSRAARRHVVSVRGRKARRGGRWKGALVERGWSLETPPLSVGRAGAGCDEFSRFEAH